MTIYSTGIAFKEPINYRVPDLPHLKFFFVRDLLTVESICLYWIDEVHVDEKYRNSPILLDLLRHETKHYRLIKEIIRLKKERKISSFLKSRLLIIYNNLWDIADCIRMELKEYIFNLIYYINKLWGRARG